MFGKQGFDLEEAMKQEDYISVASLGELSEWTPVAIENVELKKDNRGRDYTVVHYKTTACNRRLKISYFREKALIPLIQAIQMIRFKSERDMIGKTCELKLGVEHTDAGKKYVKIEAYRPVGSNGSVQSDGKVTQPTAQPTASQPAQSKGQKVQGEEVPF